MPKRESRTSKAGKAGKASKASKAAKAVSDVAEAIKSVGEGAIEFVESGVVDAPAEEVAAERNDNEKDVETTEEVIEEPNVVEDVDVDMADGEGKESALASETSKTMTMEERLAKMKELRKRMHDSSRQNRTELITESNKLKVSARDATRREKQLKLAEILREKQEAEERGEDVERKKNWEWTIEENDEWEKKMKRKKRNADFEFHDEEQQARRRYKKDLVHLKPDLAAYNKQKEAALGLAPGTLKPGSPMPSLTNGSSSNALTSFNPQGQVVSYEQQLAAESLYRDANTLLYADNKPSEEAIDRVIGKLNIDQDKRNKFSRKRLNEEEGDITYINERNRVFNKKIARYYDKYTKEIRASFERGTAL